MTDHATPRQRGIIDQMRDDEADIIAAALLAAARSARADQTRNHQ